MPANPDDFVTWKKPEPTTLWERVGAAFQAGLTLITGYPPTQVPPPPDSSIVYVMNSEQSQAGKDIQAWPKPMGPETGTGETNQSSTGQADVAKLDARISEIKHQIDGTIEALNKGGDPDALGREFEKTLTELRALGAERQRSIEEHQLEKAYDGAWERLSGVLEAQAEEWRRAQSWGGGKSKGESRVALLELAKALKDAFDQ